MNTSETPYGLICISHLRWDFVWQRPQHILSRLAKQQPILFVEEPITSLDADAPHLQILSPEETGTPNVTVVRLIQPVDAHRWIGHGDPLTQATYARLLQQHLAHDRTRDRVLWLYTPMAVDFVDAIPHQLLVFDVMDQLAKFKGAPAELVEKDKQALHRADIVLTGGVSLYRDKRRYNPNTHLFPSGVEVEHFSRAASPNLFSCPPEFRELTGPILGYFGVIDERMDLGLIEQVANARPDWNIVLIGPVVKIDPQDLPQAPNLHYLGMRNYNQLPAYLAYFDVGLIPFALNEATQYLSPTKTLEYMAAHKPIISTPIHDVVELYGEVVRVGATPESFAQGIDAALCSDPNAQYAQRMALLKLNTWDHITDSITSVLRQEFSAKTRRTAVVMSSLLAKNAVRPDSYSKRISGD